MQQYTQFMINHWPYFIALLFVLLLLWLNERSVRKHRAYELSPKAAVQLMNHEEAKIVDLRDPEHYRQGHIIDAILGKIDDFDGNKMKTYQDKALILVCQKGISSQNAAKVIREKGFQKVFVLAGGMQAWQMAELPIVKGK